MLETTSYDVLRKEWAMDGVCLPLTSTLHQGGTLSSLRQHLCPARASAGDRGQAAAPSDRLPFAPSDRLPRPLRAARGSSWRHTGSRPRQEGTVFFRNLLGTKPCFQEESKKLLPFCNQNTVPLKAAVAFLASLRFPPLLRP